VSPLFPPGSRTANITGNGSSKVRGVRPKGIEIRVHGIGDHDTFSALGRPNYKELVDSRVWIGQLPTVPTHQLRLVNWSRANRKLTRHLSWYLAFPFTLLNVAGYMEPEKDWPRRLMRAGVALASLCLTISMAAWITVILETGWQKLSTADDRLTGVVLQAIGPGLLILFIAYRMIVGRVLVDKGGTAASLATIAVLGLMIKYLHNKPASRSDDWLHRMLVPLGDRGAVVDTMTNLVLGTSAVVLLVALGLCILALWQRHNGAALAGAAVLLVLAVAMLHTAGSMLRLFTASLFQYVPPSGNKRIYFWEGIAMSNVLLPKPDAMRTPQVVKIGTAALRIDLIPVFFIAMLVVFAVVFWFKLRRQHKRNALPPAISLARPAVGEPGEPGERTSQLRSPTKPASRTHELIASLPVHLPTPVAVSIVTTAILWAVLWLALSQANARIIADILLNLQVWGAIVIVLVIIRRPEELADRLRRTFGSIADIAGFWAPDLHPLAGASYRRALLSGIRQAINDLMIDYPRDPIALVGHSQGSVVCAWFVRGGHWTERQTEALTDRQALKDNLHESGDRSPSDRIALFTCGSPLSTLYQTFFPRYFGTQFFDRTQSMTVRGSLWRNYWRETDPIGSQLHSRPGGDGNVDVTEGVVDVDVTERINEETFGHGEYWRNEALRGDIDTFFKTAVIKNRMPVSTAG
jgi:hypothetical protein